MIFITGSNGYIGHSAKLYLEALGHKVYGVNRLELQNPRILKDEKNDEQNVLIHCAWAGVEGRFRNSIEHQEQNQVLSTNVITFSRQVGVEHIIAFGSQAEYGVKNSPISEDDPLLPETEYGRAKCLAHATMREQCRDIGMSLTWLRLFDVYGPNDNPCWLIPYVIRSALSDSSPELTDCNQMWDYLYIDDVCNLLNLIIRDNGSPSSDQTFNLSSGHAVSLRVIVDQIYRYINPHSSRPLYGARSRRDGEISLLLGLNEKLRKRYGWSPEIDLQVGLAKTIEWHTRQ